MFASYTDYSFVSDFFDKLLPAPTVFWAGWAITLFVLLRHVRYSRYSREITGAEAVGYALASLFWMAVIPVFVIYLLARFDGRVMAAQVRSARRQRALDKQGREAEQKRQVLAALRENQRLDDEIARLERGER